MTEALFVEKKDGVVRRQNMQQRAGQTQGGVGLKLELDFDNDNGPTEVKAAMACT